MRKAIHQISSKHPTRDEAGDALEGAMRSLPELCGLEAAWVDHENRVHLLCTNVAGLDTLGEDDLLPGQRLIWLPAAA